MQAWLAKTVVVVLGGSVLLSQSPLTDFVSELGKVCVKYLRVLSSDGSDKVASSEGRTSDLTSTLADQVRRLTQEVRMLSSSSRPITVVNSTPGSGSHTIQGVIVPVAILGSAGYAYIWFRGYSITDLMYVTRKSMNQAVETVAKQLEQVSTTLQNTRKQLAGRIESMSATLDKSVEAQARIEGDVADVKGSVCRMGRDITHVRDTVQSLEHSVIQIQEIQERASLGIDLLVRFASDQIRGRTEPELMEYLRHYTCRGPIKGPSDGVKLLLSSLPTSAPAAVPQPLMQRSVSARALPPSNSSELNSTLSNTLTRSPHFSSRGSNWCKPLIESLSQGS